MRPVLTGALVALVVVAATGDSMARGRISTFNINPGLRQLDAAVRSQNPYRKNCFGAANAFRNNDACTFGRPRTGGSFDMVILGDSHADHFVPTMALLAEKAGLSGRQITVGGCLALLGYENRYPRTRDERCPALRASLPKLVEENPGLKLVVLAHRWSVYNGRPFADGDETKTIYLLASADDELAPQRSAEILRKSLEKTLEFFEERRIKVLLLGEVPSMGKDPTRCLARAIKNGTRPEACGRSADEVRREIEQTNALLSEHSAARKGVFFFSPVDLLCSAGWCSAVRDGLYMYRDSSHLNRMGAEQIAPLMPLPRVVPAN